MAVETEHIEKAISFAEAEIRQRTGRSKKILPGLIETAQASVDRKVKTTRSAHYDIGIAFEYLEVAPEFLRKDAEQDLSDCEAVYAQKDKSLASAALKLKALTDELADHEAAIVELNKLIEALSDRESMLEKYGVEGTERMEARYVFDISVYTGSKSLRIHSGFDKI